MGASDRASVPVIPATRTGVSVCRLYFNQLDLSPGRYG